MKLSSALKRNVAGWLFVAPALSCIDLLIFRAAVLGALSLVFAVAMAAILLVFKLNRRLILVSVICALATIFLDFAVSSFVNRYVEYSAKIAGNEVINFYAKTGHYPSPADSVVKNRKVLLYPVRYVYANASHAYLIFDQFNYRRRILDISSGHVEDSFSD